MQILKNGFTLIEVLVVLVIIIIIAAIAIPNLSSARKAAEVKSCLNTLKITKSAIRSWAIDNKKTETDTVTLNDIKSYIGSGTTTDFSKDPAGGTISVTTVGESPTSTTPDCVLSTSQ